MMLVRKLSFLIILLIFIVIVLIILKKYIFSMIIFFPSVGLLFIYYKMGLDEAVIYYVRYHGSKVKYQNILGQFGRKGESSIERLLSQNIVEKENDYIFLKKMHVDELWKYIWN